MENFELLKKKENPLFKRKEISFIIENNITPSHKEVREFISKKFSVPEENIRVKNIFGKFGIKTFTIIANIYDSEQDKLEVEGKSTKEKAMQVPEENKVVISEGAKEINPEAKEKNQEKKQEETKQEASVEKIVEEKK